MTIKKYRGESWLQFGERLCVKKSYSEENKANIRSNQQAFLKACRSGKDEFLNYIDKRLSSSLEGTIPVKWNMELSEQEFCHTPEIIQEDIWNTFKDVPKEYLCDCGFWGYVVRRTLLKANEFEPSYLAASNLNQTGIHVIDQALKDNDDKKIDDACRRILRSMCNPAPRGKRIIFNDFSLGKAYWRWHWADKMASVSGLNLDRREVLDILSEDYYAAFSEKMHSGSSCIGSEKILGGLLLFLKKNSNIGQKSLRQIIKGITQVSAWKALEMQEPKQNRKDIEQIYRHLS